MGSKDLSTLVKAIALAFLFNVPAVAFSADTYGVNASKEDVKLTDTNLIENVTYGAWVDKGHQAEINSNGLTISARKAVAYIKSGKWGGVDLQANEGDLNLSVVSDGIIDGLFIEQSSSAKAESSINAQGKNILFNIHSNTSTARGIQVSNKASAKFDAVVNVSARDNLTLDVSGTKFAKGVSAEGEYSKVNLRANQLAINTTQQDKASTDSAYAYGLFAQGSGNVQATADTVSISVVNAGKGNAFAIYAKSNGSSDKPLTTIGVDGREISLSARANTDVDGYRAVGVFGYGDSGNSSSIHIGSDQTEKLTISTENKIGDAVGVFTYIKEDQNTGGEIVLKGNEININAIGKTASGIVASYGLQKGASVQIGEADSVINVNVNGTDDALGIFALEHGQVAINGKVLVIEAKSDKLSTGIHVQNNGKGGELAKVDVNSLNTSITADDALNVYSEGVLNMNGNIFIDAKNAVVTRGNSLVNINAGADQIVRLNGDINFNVTNDGNSGKIADSTVNLDLNNPDSYLKGNIIKTQTGDPTEVDMTVTHMSLGLSNGGTWETNAASFVNNLTLDDGVISLSGDAEQKVEVDYMTGHGTVNLAVDLQAQEGKQSATLTVAKAKDATLDVKLKTKDLKNDLTSDEINADQAKSLLNNVGQQSVVKTSTKVKEGMVNEGFAIDTEGHSHSTGPNTLMQSTLELASSAPLALNRIMMNDVRKRLGDIRSSYGTHGAWVRYDGGKLSSKADLENDFHTIQVGIDTVPAADSARMGVAFSYTDSNAEYARGSADMKAYSLAMYATKMFEDGMFVDVIGRMGTADTDLVVDGQHKGSMNNVALSLSGEMGWRFDLSNMVYVEPQAEVTYSYVNDDKITLSTANYDIEAVDSLMGRVGFVAGLKCPVDKGNVYLRASAVHEFLGDSKITGVNGNKFNTYEIDGQDTWVEYGIGANLNLTKSTYVWADVERTTGGTLDEDWRATVGVRYAW